MLERKNIATGTKWKAVAGYSRAVRLGTTICVSGTTATNADGGIVGRGDPSAQTLQTIRNMQRALQHAGAPLQAWCTRASMSSTSTIASRSAAPMASFSAPSGLRPAWCR